MKSNRRGFFGMVAAAGATATATAQKQEPIALPPQAVTNITVNSNTDPEEVARAVVKMMKIKTPHFV